MHPPSVCQARLITFTVRKVETPIHDSIRDLVTRERKERGVKS